MEVKKNKKLSIKDFAKDNSPGMRLKSIRMPRDLRLGGTKHHKKVYKPNINVIRHKNKDKDVTNLKIIKDAGKPAVILKDKLKERFIQSTGVFSEGINFDMLKVQRAVKSTTIERDKKDISVSLINKHLIKDSTASLENDTMKELLGCHDSCSSSSDTDDKVFFEPVTWSMIGESLKDELIDDKLKSTSNKIFDYFDSEAKFSLWQLPSSFASKINVSDSKIRKTVDIKLSDMLEGEIGRIRVRRSGRIEAFMGDKKYDLESSLLDSCSEDIVAINIGPENSTMSVLGEIDCKFILSPDWSYLLC